MKGHSCDFPMYTFLISLNAFDPPLNDWLSECVHHDTDPFQLLRSNRCLPMDRIVGNSIGYVMIYTPHELWYSHLCTSELLPTIIESGVHIYSLVYTVHTYFQAWHIGKNNHLCTTPAWLHPAHVALYICYVPGIFECLNPFYKLGNMNESETTTEPRSLQ